MGRQTKEIRRALAPIDPRLATAQPVPLPDASMSIGEKVNQRRAELRQGTKRKKD
jgi:hypothetical protein